MKIAHVYHVSCPVYTIYKTVILQYNCLCDNFTIENYVIGCNSCIYIQGCQEGVTCETFVMGPALKRALLSGSDMSHNVSDNSQAAVRVYCFHSKQSCQYKLFYI